MLIGIFERNSGCTVRFGIPLQWVQVNGLTHTTTKNGKHLASFENLQSSEFVSLQCLQVDKFTVIMMDLYPIPSRCGGCRLLCNGDVVKRHVMILAGHHKLSYLR